MLERYAMKVARTRSDGPHEHRNGGYAPDPSTISGQTAGDALHQAFAHVWLLAASRSVPIPRLPQPNSPQS
jgi:hypothetical protein